MPPQVAGFAGGRASGGQVVKSFERIAMEHCIGIGALEDINAWFTANLDTDPALQEILRGPQTEKPEAFLRFALQQRAFDPTGPAGAVECVNILRDLASDVLHGTLPVVQFGRTITRLDELLLDSEHYPEVLRRLWNAFDWCDDGWTLENQPHIRTELETLVSGTADALQR